MEPRRFSTVFGEVKIPKIPIRVAECVKCGARYSPLLSALKIGRYARREVNFEYEVIESVIDTNYRRLIPACCKQVKTRYDKSKAEIKELVQTFYNKGYRHGASYLEKLSDRIFTNIELWLKTPVCPPGRGVIAPKTTSLLERLFRELGRRLKKIAWGWSDMGATNISKMIMIRQYSREKWEQYWRNKLGIKGYFNIHIESVEVS